MPVTNYYAETDSKCRTMETKFPSHVFTSEEVNRKAKKNFSFFSNCICSIEKNIRED